MTTPNQAMRATKRSFSSGVVLGFVLGVGSLGAFGLGSLALADDGAETLYRKLEILAQVLAAVENHYVDSVAPTTLVYNAAKGVAGKLDEHSAFFTPDEYRRLVDATEGEYAGIGIEIDFEEGAYPRIVGVLDGSAAARAGLLVGDDLVSIDGKPITDESLDLIENKLRGPVGSKVVLGIRRAGRADAWTFTLVRAWIRMAPIEHRRLDGDVLYVHIKTFSRRVAADFDAVLNRDKDARGLVLDLRGNPGGLFDEAVAICDAFLSEGPIVSAVGREGRLLERHEAKKRGTEPTYKIAILIDGDSASAAEIVAGALSDRGRARLFGSRSYGKGSVQSIVDLSDGSGLKLTVARYFMPSGRRIDGNGIEPDVAITSIQAGADLVLAAARSWVLEPPR